MGLLSFIQKLPAWYQPKVVRPAAVMSGQGSVPQAPAGRRSTPLQTPADLDSFAKTEPGQNLIVSVASVAGISGPAQGLPKNFTNPEQAPPAPVVMVPPAPSAPVPRQTLSSRFNSVGRNVLGPAALGILAGYGVKQAAGIALALLPGGFVVGAAVGALASFTAGVAQDRIKGQKSSWKKHFVRATSGAISGIIGVDAADGFDTFKSQFNKASEWAAESDTLKSVWKSVSAWKIFGADTRAVIRQTAVAAHAASAPALRASAAAAELVESSAEKLARELKVLRETSDAAREATRNAAQQAKDVVRRAARITPKVNVQELQKTWNSAPVITTVRDIPPVDSAPLGSTLVNAPDAARPSVALRNTPGGIAPPSGLSDLPVDTNVSALANSVSINMAAAAPAASLSPASSVAGVADSVSSDRTLLTTVQVTLPSGVTLTGAGPEIAGVLEKLTEQAAAGNVDPGRATTLVAALNP